MRIKQKLSFWALVLATLPCALLAILVGLVEVNVGSRAGLASAVARPFLWAVERED